MTEKNIQNDVLRVLGTRADMRIWRNNRIEGITGATKIFIKNADVLIGGKPAHLQNIMAYIGGRYQSAGVDGQADLSGIYKDGRRLEVEIKTETGKLSEKQNNFKNVIDVFNGIYIIIRNASELEAAVRKMENGNY